MAHKTEHSTAESVENVISKTEIFFEKNQKLLLYFGIAVILLVGGYFGVKYLYVEPQEKEAATQMFAAERYFEVDSLQIALNGNGQHSGFLDIIDNYGITPSANRAQYYAGIAFLHLGQFQEAIQHLKKFNAKKDPILFALSQQAMGDAHLELGQDQEAIKCYLAAAHKYPNKQTSPMPLLRAAFVCEKSGKNAEALKYYQELQSSYPQSQEAADCDKYIARVEARII